jgi:hypothetical protein
MMLLSSDSSGEVCAAAAKVSLLLQKHDRDWHDLCDHLVADRTVAPVTQPQSAATWSAGTGRQIDAEQLRGIIEAIRQSGTWLSASARGFLESLECRATAYSHVNLSEKQHVWLLDLASQASKV